MHACCHRARVHTQSSDSLRDKYLYLPYMAAPDLRRAGLASFAASPEPYAASSNNLEVCTQRASRRERVSQKRHRVSELGQVTNILASPSVPVPPKLALK